MSLSKPVGLVAWLSVLAMFWCWSLGVIKVDLMSSIALFIFMLVAGVCSMAQLVKK